MNTRFDNQRKIVTLEEDIIQIWKLHGWKVLEEKVKGNVWKIKAELMRKGLKR